MRRPARLSARTSHDLFLSTSIKSPIETARIIFMGNKELAVTVTVIATIGCLFGELKNPNSGVSPITGKPYRKASVVTGPERERYLALARSWASKLWVTNETYVGHIMQNNRPTWDPLPGFGQTRLKNARKTWSREMQRDEASGRKGLR